MKNTFYSRLSRRMVLISFCSSMYLYSSEPPSQTKQYQTNTLQGMIAKSLDTLGSNEIDMPPFDAQIPLAKGVMEVEATARRSIQPFTSLKGAAKELSEWDPPGELGKLLKSDVNTLPAIFNHRINKLQQETWNSIHKFQTATMKSLYTFRQETWNSLRNPTYVLCACGAIALFCLVYIAWNSRQKIKLDKRYLHIEEETLKLSEKNYGLQEKKYNQQERFIQAIKRQTEAIAANTATLAQLINVGRINYLPRSNSEPFLLSPLPRRRRGLIPDTNNILSSEVPHVST